MQDGTRVSVPLVQTEAMIPVRLETECRAELGGDASPRGTNVNSKQSICNSEEVVWRLNCALGIVCWEEWQPSDAMR